MHGQHTTSSHRRGFTLIEASLATTIIGIGVLAMLQLLAAGTMANSEGTELTTGMNLAKNIRELSLGLAYTDPTQPLHWGPETGEILASYDDINDLAGQSFSPPIDARRQVLSDYANWQQTVTVQSVNPDRLTTPVIPNSPDVPATRVTVTVTHNNHFVCDLSWYTFDASHE